jgi:hypothetical protein
MSTHIDGHLASSSWRASVALLVAVVAMLVAFAGGAAPATSGDTMAMPGTAQEDGEFFTDRAAEYGLDFVHFNAMTGALLLHEMTGQGGALLDYDNDGDLDAYFVQGTLTGSGKTMEDALFPLAEHLSPGDQLYRNDLSASPLESPSVRFENVTSASTIRALGYGMGATVADFDNDGWNDIYVTNVGSNQLLRNNGDGTFSDITDASGTDNPLWSTSASFVDYDRDGWLDLYVANYVEFDLEKNPRCYALTSRLDYCGPDAFAPKPDSLFRSRGDGTFEDVTATALLMYEPGPGLGVVAADYDGDGWIDIYVANDGRLNHLWINQQDGTFIDDSLIAGVAVNRDGRAEASMGVDAGDFDLDGDEDLFMTHLMGETNTLYVNDGAGFFEDRTVERGLGQASFSYTSFGTRWFDYDNDAWLDLLMMNGAVRIIEALAAAGDPYPIHQRNQLFHNEAGERFVEVTDTAGDIFELSEVSRGAAFGDVDNDGDTDVLLINNNGPARLLINNVGNQHSWVGLELITRGDNRHLLGARVAVLRPGDTPPVWRRVGSDGSFCSSSDHRVLVGLGDVEGEISLRVLTSEGQAHKVEGLRPGMYYTLWLDSGSQGASEQ